MGFGCKQQHFVFYSTVHAPAANSPANCLKQTVASVSHSTCPSHTDLHILLVLWRACNLTLFSPCLTGPVDYLFASRHKGLRFKSPGDTHVNWDSPVSVVSLHWWPRRDWSLLWPRLRRASSWTITRPSCRKCDNPTWSHIAFLSRFHVCCRSPFQLHNWRSRLLGGSPV